MSRLNPSLAALLLSVTVAACANSGDEGIQIVDNMFPGAQCALDPTTTTFKARGAIDLYSTAPYTFNALLRSRVTAIMGQENQKTIFAQGARVDITFTDPSALGLAPADLTDLQTKGLTKFTSRFSAPIPPNSNSVGQYDLVTPALLEFIKSKVDASKSVRVGLLTSVVVFGDMAGSQVTSQPYEYPITVCNDCVVNVVSTCGTLPMGFMARSGDPCNISQDGPVDCCTSAAGKLVCPAVSGTAAN
jgi:hypothetical protein